MTDDGSAQAPSRAETATAAGVAVGRGGDFKVGNQKLEVLICCRAFTLHQRKDKYRPRVTGAALTKDTRSNRRQWPEQFLCVPNRAGL